MKKFLVLSALLSIFWQSAAFGQTSDERIKQLEDILQKIQQELKDLKDEQKKQGEKVQETDVLKEEIRKLRLEVAVPEVEYKSYTGLGPAASKVYYSPHGLSIGGYGEVTYHHFFDRTKTDEGEVRRLIPYIGYKFSDTILMNAEIEFEYGGKEVSVEFAYLDFLINPKFNMRTGLILMPVSRLNEYHEPVTFFGVLKPDVETFIIPTTWTELGIMAYGDLGKGFSYKTALTSGLRTEDIADWIRAGRQGGSEVNFSKFAGIARIDYSGVPGLNIGGSIYYGGGESKEGGEERGNERANFSLYVLDAQYQKGNTYLKGLYSLGKASGNDAYMTKGRAKQVYGWYAEAGYNILPHIKPDSTMSLTPFARYERYNLNDKVFLGSPDKTKDRKVLTIGLDFKPILNVVIKADYQRRDTKSDLPKGLGEGLDENKIAQFNLGVGFIF